VKVHLLHTNDVHSQVENYLRLGARLRALREQIRHEGQPVLTFDIGDVLDRVRPETEATLGRLNAALMRALEYDGWVFGNNEGLTIPVSAWRDLVRLSGTTVFGTNLRGRGGEAFSYFADHRIYEQAGLRIGVFGVTPNYDLAYRALQVRALPPLARARETARRLRGEGCHIVIALSHLGLPEDHRLAAEVPEIDVILGGHTHHFLTGAEWVGHTAIFQAGKHALAFGHTVVDYDPVAGRVRGVVSETVPVPLDGPPDAAMASVYEEWLPRIGESLGQPVAALPHPLPVAFDEESLFANVLVEALFDAYPCDLGVMMAGALNASLLAGQVRLRDVLGACSTPTRPLLVTLKGREIQAIIDKSLQPEYYGRHGFGFGFRGALVGRLALAGASVEVVPDGPGRWKARRILIGGRVLEPDQTYRVVTCEYLWLAPVFREFQAGRDVEVKAPLVREVLLARLNDARLIERARTPRYVMQSL
jgi:5'-nucleotidase